MNKKILYTVFGLLFAVSSAMTITESPVVFALASTPDPASTSGSAGSPSASEKTGSIRDYIEKIASAASAKDKTKTETSIAADLKAVGKDNLTVVADQGEYTVNIDSGTKLSKYASGAQKTIKTADLNIGDKLIIAGSSSIDKNIIASRIVAGSALSFFRGLAVKTDRTDGTITVINGKNTEFTVDVETSTKINLYDEKTQNILRHGLSKINSGDVVYVLGSGTQNNRLSAERILVFRPGALNLNIDLPAPLSSPGATATVSASVSPASPPATRSPSPPLPN